MSSKLLRANMLKQLRKHARAEPEIFESEPEKLCDKLYTHIVSQYCKPVTSTHITDKQLHKSLYVLSYLPLYYEVDLRPLMHRLWQCNTNTAKTCSDAYTSNVCKEECNTTSECINAMQQCVSDCEQLNLSICIMVPVVLDPTVWSTTAITSTNCSVVEKKQNREWPSWLPRLEPDDNSDAVQRLRGAMMFVEVFDEDDLQNSFAEYGKFHIVELKRELLDTFFVPRKANMVQTTPDAEKEENLEERSTQTHRNVDTLRTHSRVRRVLFSRSFAYLFPDYLSPIGEVHWEHCCNHINISITNTDVSSSTAVLLLAPGVYFDRNSGARIGKGGGYYDRFIHYHRSRCAHNNEWCLMTNVHISANNSNEKYNTYDKQCKNEILECETQSITPSWSGNVKHAAQDKYSEGINKDQKTPIKKNACSEVHHVTFDVIGIGFDEQVNRRVVSDVSLPMQLHDECVDYIATPTYGVEKICTETLSETLS